MNQRGGGNGSKDTRMEDDGSRDLQMGDDGSRDPWVKDNGISTQAAVAESTYIRGGHSLRKTKARDKGP